MIENSWPSRPFLRPARSTTTCCRRRCGSSSGARRSRPSRSRRCRPTGASRSSRPTIRRCCRSAGSGRATCCTCRRAVRSRRTKCGWRARSARCWRCATARSSIRSRCSSATELFRGAIEDRYVSAFLDSLAPGRVRRSSRADLFATAIEVLRVAALSSYENRAISSGVLLLDEDDDREHDVRAARRAGLPLFAGADRHQELLPDVRRIATLFLVNRQGSVLDVVDVARYARAVPLEVPCPTPYRAHALATVGNQRSASSSARRTRSRCSRRACRSSASATRGGTCST